MNYISGYDPATGICWQFRNKGDSDRAWRCKCPASSSGHGKRTLAFFGRCRSGARWFWAAGTLDGKQAYDWANSEPEAMAAATAAVCGFRDGLSVCARLSHDTATYRLKELNKEKRAARPASNSKESRPDAYLYSRWGDQFRIIKKTKERIYYNKSKLNGSAFSYLNYNDDAIGFIPRSRVKADCDFEDSSYGMLYLSKPQRPAQEPELPDINKLKRAMADAHPDRGGSSAAFIAARKEYLAALRAKRAAR